MLPEIFSTPFFIEISMADGECLSVFPSGGAKGLTTRAVTRVGREGRRPGRNFRRGAKTDKSCFYSVYELNKLRSFINE